jgi:hypothetical protein
VSQTVVIQFFSRPRFHSFAFISFFSLAHGVLELGSSWVRCSLYQFELVASLYLLPLIGSGIVSLRLLLLTWSIKIKAIWALKFSSFGVRFVSDAGFGHISRYTKLKVRLFRLFLSSLAYFAELIVVFGVSLEQVDKLLVESTPRKSKYWVPTNTFASEMGIDEKSGSEDLQTVMIEDVKRSGSGV